MNARADRGFTFLHRAAQSAEHSVVTRLLKGRADPNARTESGDAPLHSAVVYIANGEVLSANPPIITAPLKSGADLEARNLSGRTPLHRAAESGDRAVFLALIDAGANPRTSKRRGVPLRHP